MKRCFGPIFDVYVMCVTCMDSRKVKTTTSSLKMYMVSGYFELDALICRDYVTMKLILSYFYNRIVLAMCERQSKTLISQTCDAFEYEAALCAFVFYISYNAFVESKNIKARSKIEPS